VPYTTGMLEGTKNEKAVIALIAYIIGLTTGFIAFSMTEKSVEKVIFYPTVATSQSTVDTVAVPVTADPTQNSSTPTVEYKDGYLMVFSGEQQLVLSAHTDTLTDGVPDILLKQGHHTIEPVFSVSEDGRFVHFCEQHIDTTGCVHFVYDSQEVAIRYAEVEREKLITPLTMAASAYWAADGLHIGSYRSETAVTPWKLTVDQTQQVDFVE
jgi:hypothetical protein